MKHLKKNIYLTISFFYEIVLIKLVIVNNKNGNVLEMILLLSKYDVCKNMSMTALSRARWHMRLEGVKEGGPL